MGGDRQYQQFWCEARFMRADSPVTDPTRVAPRRINGLSRALTAGLLVCLLAAIPFLASLRPDHYGIASNAVAPPFRLTDVAGNEVTLSDFGGRFVFLMFGYLNCPDVCHTQALTFQQVAQTLQGREAELVFAYVAIDPARDTPAEVGHYFDGRGDNFISLHGTSELELQSLAAAYRVFFARRGGLQSAEYEIDHTALFFLVDQSGRLRYTYVASQQDSGRIIEDLERLGNRSRGNNPGFAKRDSS